MAAVPVRSFWSIPLRIPWWLYATIFVALSAPFVRSPLLSPLYFEGAAGDLAWWQYALLILGSMHLLALAVTIYLHREQAHRALVLHPAVRNFFRIILWMWTSMSSREWVAVHRKHHKFVDKAGDPHTPALHKRSVLWILYFVFWKGVMLYKDAAVDEKMVKEHTPEMRDDWLETRVFIPYRLWGMHVFGAIAVLLVGLVPAMIWIYALTLFNPIFAAGIINGIGHYWGARNFETTDASRNIVPIGVLIAGEELHNNHHQYPSSARFSVKPYEFDIGWMWIRVLEFLNLATVKRVWSKERTAAQTH